MLNVQRIYAELFANDLEKQFPGTITSLEGTHTLIIVCANRQQRNKIMNAIAENIESLSDFKTIKLSDLVTNYCLEIPVKLSITYKRRVG